MPHRSNRTDSASVRQGLEVLGGVSEQPSVSRGVQFLTDSQPSISKGVELLSEATTTPSTDPKKPAGRQPEEGLLEKGFQAAFGTLGQLAEEASEGDLEGFGRVAIGRIGELAAATARGALAIPAGVERLLHAGIEEVTNEQIPEIVQVGDVPISTEPYQELVAQTEHLGDMAAEFTGGDPNPLTQFAGEVVGGYATGNQLFKIPGFVNKFVTERFGPALFRPLTKGQMTAKALSGLSDDVANAVTNPSRLGSAAERLARTATAGTEGALFMAGLPDTDKQDILIGGITGLGLQGGAEIIGAVGSRLASKAEKAFPTKVDEIRRISQSGDDIEIEGFPEFMARQDANVRLGSQYGQTSDEAVASIKTVLSERGETGAIGAARGLTDLTEEQIANLERSFPDYRFEIVMDVAGEASKDQKLLFGLKPGQRLPEGTRSAPSLTDKVVQNFRQTGLLRDQKVLVDGIEHRFLSVLDDGDVLVKPPQGSPVSVPRERVARLDESAGLLKNDRLVQQFRQWRTSQQIDDFDEAVGAFADRFLDDLPDAHRPHLRNYLAEQETKFLAQRLRPDEKRALQQFRSARKQLLEEGSPQGLETLAASRGHVTHHMSGGRVKLTDMVTGETRGPFRNADRATEYLNDLEVEVPDITPSITGVPDDLLHGMAIPHPRPNPSIPSGAELESAGIMDMLKSAPEAFSNFWTRYGGRWFTDVESSARRIDEELGTSIWNDAIRPLQQDLRIAKNRSKQFGDRLANIFKGTDETEQDLIEGWLRSERKETFEAAHDMPARLVSKAEELRLWYEDLFDEFTTSTGVDLDADDWLRNYAPDMMDYTAQTGKNDHIELFQRTQDQVPNEPIFFAEMFKSGEAAQMPQMPMAAKAARTLRSGMFKAHTGANFERAIQLANDMDNNVAKRHLVQYLEGIRGHTDMLRDRLNSATQTFLSDLGVRASDADTRNLIDSMIDATYGGTMAFRPSLIMRNLTQPMNLLGPVIDDFGMVLRAQKDALKPRHQNWARRLGILEERQAVTFAESFEEGTGFLNRLGQKGLKAYSSADKHNRVAAALAVKRKLDPLVEEFQSGTINATDLLERSGLWFMDQPQRQTFFELLDGGLPQGAERLGDNAAERAVNFAADEIGSKAVNFLYGARNAHKWLRSTPGRVVGAYSTWPRGYLNYITHLITADVRTGIKLKALAKHGTFNTALVNAGKAAGVGLGSWVAWNSLTFGGSPLLDVVVNAKDAWGGLPFEREEALRELSRQSPRLFLPGGQLLFGDLPTAYERLSQDDPFGALMEATGFRRLEEGNRQAAFPTPFGDIPPEDRSTAQDATGIGGVR